MPTIDHPQLSPALPTGRAVQARPAPIPLADHRPVGGQGTVIGCAPEPPPAPLRSVRSPVLDDDQASAERAPGAVPDEIAGQIWCGGDDRRGADDSCVRHIPLVRVVLPRRAGAGRSRPPNQVGGWR